ncbi:MAG: hypothetical protein PGN23_14040 [Sphingomonas adhaesiva]|uniref:hypothetical protein n=1 Tax=Sphingomonas adhaesiva TaxID=28212 RepID=UPI002FFB9885
MRRAAVWLLPATLLVAAPAAAHFAPPVGRDLWLDRVEVRDDGRGVRTLRAARRVRFERAGKGYVAVMAVDPARVEDSRGDHSPYVALVRTLAAPIAVELDAAGQMVRVREADAAWARLRGVIAGPSPDAARAAALRVHDATGAAERDAALAGPLLAVLGAGDADRAPGVRAVALPAGATGTGTLAGTERTARQGARTVLEIDASGTIDTAQGASEVTLFRRRTIDRGTGLSLETVEKRTSTASDGGVLRNEVTVTIKPAVS